LKLKEHRV
jgi:hypothetical protein